jgi:zinc protease
VSTLRTFFIAGLITTMTIQSAFAIAGVDKAPAPGPPHETSFVKPKEFKLDNGLRVIVAERPGLPLLAAQVVIRNGSEVDPADRAGTASMTGSLLTKGTDKMSAPEIAAAIESLGGTIFSSAGWDASSAGIVAMSDKAEPALGILSDVVMRPTFKPEELERLRKQTLDRLRVSLEQPGTVASYVTTRVVFPSGEYAHSSGGTVETIEAIGREDIAKLYRTYYRPENAVLIFSGNLTSEQGRGYAQKFFGDWKGDAAAQPDKAPAADTHDWKPQNVVVDMPLAGQAAVSVTNPAIKRTSPDFYSGMVANAALGSGFASRLNREIRIKRGLSYGARSALDPRRDAGPFVASAQTKNESAAEVARLLQGELKRLGQEPVQGDELKSRQAMLTGGYARSMETNQGVAGQISALATYSLPLDTLDKFIPSINGVTTENITAFVKKYFASPGAVVIAGKAAAFIEPLKKENADVKVIAQKDLDLNRADLVKQK